MPFSSSPPALSVLLEPSKPSGSDGSAEFSPVSTVPYLKSALKSSKGTFEPATSINPKPRTPVVTFDSVPHIKKIPTTDTNDEPKKAPVPSPISSTKKIPLQKSILKSKHNDLESKASVTSLNYYGLNDVITKSNTMINAGGLLKVLRRKSAKRRLSLAKGVGFVRHVTNVIPLERTIKPPELPSKQLERLRASFIQIGIPPTNSDFPEGDNLPGDFKEHMEEGEGIEEAKLPEMYPSITGSMLEEMEEERNREELTVAMVEANGPFKYSQRHNAISAYKRFKGRRCSSLFKDSELSIFNKVRQVDFETVDLRKLRSFVAALTRQDMAYDMPLKLHARKMAEFEDKADEEMARIIELIDPEPVSHARPPPSYMNPLIRQFREHCRRCQGMYTANFKSAPKKHRRHPKRSSYHKKYVPSPAVVQKVMDWMNKNEAILASPLPRKVSTSIWMPPLFAELKKRIEEKHLVRKFFNIANGRVLVPFYNINTKNSFAVRRGPLPNSTSIHSMLHRKKPYDKFYAIVNLSGFLSSEISFEYQTHVIYVSARNFHQDLVPRDIKRVEESVIIPPRLELTDLEFSFGNDGILLIQELSDGEKEHMKELVKLFESSQVSLHRIFTLS